MPPPLCSSLILQALPPACWHDTKPPRILWQGCTDESNPAPLPTGSPRGHITKRKGEHTMKFNNIFEQINVELPAQWKIQTLRREIQRSPGKAAELQPQIDAAGSPLSVPAAATSTPPDPLPDALAGLHRPKQPRPIAPPGLLRNTKRGSHHDNAKRCPGLLPHAGQSGMGDGPQPGNRNPRFRRFPSPVLEPSAGDGALARQIHTTSGIYHDPKRERSAGSIWTGWKRLILTASSFPVISGRSSRKTISAWCMTIFSRSAPARSMRQS